MLKIRVIILMLVVLSSPVMTATKITDVPKSSGAYKAMQKSVDLGYLSLQGQGKFNPNGVVTRQEMALVLDKLIKTTKSNKGKLSKEETKELLLLSKSFKKYLINQEKESHKFGFKVTEVEDEQKVLNEDLTRLTEHIRHLKAVNTDQSNINDVQKRIIWVAAFLAIVGILT